MRVVLLAALAACGPSADLPIAAGTPTGLAASPIGGTPTGTVPTGGGPTVPTGGWQCRSDIPADQLHGGYPNEELQMVDFTAYNYDGSERHKVDLQGHVTVMWFYPAAGTSG